MTTRAAVEAARAVFEFSSGLLPREATTTPEWQATSARLTTPRLRSEAMWLAAEKVLQLVADHQAMTGQTLIGEVRRQERITLDDAHALVSLYGWYEQIHHPMAGEASPHVDREGPPSAFEQRIAKEVWRALEHAGTDTVSANVAATSAAAATTTVRNNDTNEPGPIAPVFEPAPSRTASPLPYNVTPPERTRSLSSGLLLFATACLLIASAVVWHLYVGQGDKDFLAGVAAYQRGANEVARLAFTKAANARPEDPNALVYLGRIARDEHDLVQAKAYLERAIRLTPPNAMAMREMAATLLLEGNAELARRFYVRAVELDPSDKLAQGFLGCALKRIGRTEEAERWGERAGPGEWTACIKSAAATPSNPITPSRL